MAAKEERSRLLPLLKERLLEPRSVFAPGSRLRMNIVPLFLNLFVPWGVFILCCGLTGFYMMYSEPGLVASLVGMLSLIWFALAYTAVLARKYDPEPTWFTYVALAFGAGVFGGSAAGRSIYSSFSRDYYEILDLKVVHQLDAGQEQGRNLMDAGILYFAHGNHLDATRSWHFRHRSLFCVAPVVPRGGKPLTQSFDFWAVGEDCCSTTSSDFRCGRDWANGKARSGIRVLDGESLKYYRLAVQQAESLYGIVAAHPIFFTWTQDPVAEVTSWNAQAYKNYVFLVALAFVVSLLCVILATCKFAWIGRARSVYETDFLNDPDWKTENSARPADHQTRSYSAA